ncbi:hypothetical protein GEV33_001796 [Tenebrio molitor]|jgi:hypothetical protein|uniref:Uncharacterized protein n=1 Tax=Tenebrio molitor TaxID=7067 RepID=A0A8J6HUI3_TENMO|nr:hypothetical protein GEV33_001796 [Tenebrio molitor]
MDKELKTTMIGEIREEIKTLRKELAEVREENPGAKERISDSERGYERKRRKRAGGEGRLDEKDENDGTKRKGGEEE